MSEKQVTELVIDANQLEELTDNQETDCHTALTRGLKEFLLSIPASVITDTVNKSQQLIFTSIEEDWVEPSNNEAKFPMVGIYCTEPGVYDDDQLTTHTEQLSNGRELQMSAEYNQVITVDMWAGNRTQRAELCKILENYFSPVDWMDGFRLKLPHYFGAHAEFLLTSVDYVDGEENSGKRWRMAQFQLEGRVQKIKLLGERPRLQPKLQLTVRNRDS